MGNYWASITLESAWPANEASAVGTLRTLATAEDAFSHSSGKKNAQDYGTMDDLSSRGLIPRDLGPTRRGYRFTVDPTDARKRYLISAVPLVLAKRNDPSFIPGASWLRKSGAYARGGTGVRSFAVDESGVIRYTDAPLLQPPTKEEALKWKSLQ